MKKNFRVAIIKSKQASSLIKTGDGVLVNCEGVPNLVEGETFQHIYFLSNDRIIDGSFFIQLETTECYASLRKYTPNWDFTLSEMYGTYDKLGYYPYSNRAGVCVNTGHIRSRDMVIASTNRITNTLSIPEYYLNYFIEQFNLGNVLSEVPLIAESGVINVFEETIDDSIHLTYFNEHGEYEGLLVSDNHVIPALPRRKFNENK